MEFFNSLEKGDRAVDVVVRELLRSVESPLRSAVVSRYGGLEYPTCSDSERSLMERTFLNPHWYYETSAHYRSSSRPWKPCAVEDLMLATTKLVGTTKLAKGSANGHIALSIFAVKTEVLAIESALEKSVEKDFYISDLFDVFRAVQERSKFDETVWQKALSVTSSFPRPTPTCCTRSRRTSTICHPLLYRKPSALLESRKPKRQEKSHRLFARTWSFCVWSIADSQHQVGAKFRDSIIEQYLFSY